MQKKHRIVHLMLLMFSIFILSNYVQASNLIKIALLDTPYNEMPLNLSLLPEYEKAYLAGAEVAAHVAKKYNYNVQYKPFFYGEGPLDILNETPKILAWNADFVIGPSSSDQFLLLKDYLPSTMVLSSYSSDRQLQHMPSNFYSTFLPDTLIMKILGTYIKSKYPQKNIYIIEQADCKQCVDVGQIFISDYKKYSPMSKTTETKIIMDDINSIESKKLLAGHEDDVILAFNTTYYAYSKLIEHLSAAFPKNHLLFFSDQDDWDAKLVNDDAHPKALNYTSYRICPILFDSSYPEYKDFEQAYAKIYRAEPTNSVSYATYLTVMSVIKALKKYPNSNDSMREKILHSYRAALKKNPNWFRPTTYGIYLLTSQGEILTSTLPVPKTN